MSKTPQTAMRNKGSSKKAAPMKTTSTRSKKDLKVAESESINESDDPPSLLDLGLVQGTGKGTKGGKASTKPKVGPVTAMKSTNSSCVTAMKGSTQKRQEPTPSTIAPRTNYNSSTTSSKGVKGRLRESGEKDTSPTTPFQKSTIKARKLSCEFDEAVDEVGENNSNGNSAQDLDSKNRSSTVTSAVHDDDYVFNTPGGKSQSAKESRKKTDLTFSSNSDKSHISLSDSESENDNVNPDKATNSNSHLLPNQASTPQPSLSQISQASSPDSLKNQNEELLNLSGNRTADSSLSSFDSQEPNTDQSMQLMSFVTPLEQIKSKVDTPDAPIRGGKSLGGEDGLDKGQSKFSSGKDSDSLRQSSLDALRLINRCNSLSRETNESDGRGGDRSIPRSLRSGLSGKSLNEEFERSAEEEKLEKSQESQEKLKSKKRASESGALARKIDWSNSPAKNRTETESPVVFDSENDDSIEEIEDSDDEANLSTKRVKETVTGSDNKHATNNSPQAPTSDIPTLTSAQPPLKTVSTPKKRGLTRQFTSGSSSAPGGNSTPTAKAAKRQSQLQQPQFTSNPRSQLPPGFTPGVSSTSSVAEQAAFRGMAGGVKELRTVTAQDYNTVTGGPGSLNALAGQIQASGPNSHVGRALSPQLRAGETQLEARMRQTLIGFDLKGERGISQNAVLSERFQKAERFLVVRGKVGQGEAGGMYSQEKLNVMMMQGSTSGTVTSSEAIRNVEIVDMSKNLNLTERETSAGVSTVTGPGSSSSSRGSASFTFEDVSNFSKLLQDVKVFFIAQYDPVQPPRTLAQMNQNLNRNQTATQKRSLKRAASTATSSASDQLMTIGNSSSGVYSEQEANTAASNTTDPSRRSSPLQQLTDLLHAFDLDATSYGPSLGVGRTERWNRARKLGLNPPVALFPFLNEGVVVWKTVRGAF